MTSNINMRHIEAFRAVMMAGTVVGAARLLNLTQPSVSRTIGLLESKLNYDLFERRGRRLFPTVEAEALYREIEQSYAGIERINQVAQDIRHHRAGSLRIATLPALGHSVVPQTLAHFLKTRPKVSVFVQSLPSRQIAELVATKQFDLGVVELPLYKTGTRVIALPSARTMAVMRRDHALATRALISLSDLANERMVLPSPHSYVRYQIDDAFTQLGIRPNISVETATSTIACALAAAGVGIALVSQWAAVPHMDKDTLAIPIKEEVHSKYGLMQPSTNSAMILVSEFSELLSEIMSTNAER